MVIGPANDRLQCNSRKETHMKRIARSPKPLTRPLTATSYLSRSQSPASGSRSRSNGALTLMRLSTSVVMEHSATFAASVTGGLGSW